jgi:ribokinase
MRNSGAGARHNKLPRPGASVRSIDKGNSTNNNRFTLDCARRLRVVDAATRAVVCIGNANIDVYPDSGEEFFGGSAANTAVRLADLATAGEFEPADILLVYLLAAVGSDARGDSIANLLTCRGVRSNFLLRVPGESQQSGITLEETGERVIQRGERKVAELVNHIHDLSQHGFLPLESAGNLPSVFSDPPQPWVHVKAQVPVLQAIAEDGVRLGSLDLGSIEIAEDWFALTPNLQVSVVSGNGAEVGRAGGIEALWENATVELICVKKGARGATLLQRDGPKLNFDPFPVDAADTTGAGDAFNAGIIWGILHRWPVPEMGRLACALGALTCTERGAQNPPVTLARLRDIGYTMPPGTA